MKPLSVPKSIVLGLLLCLPACGRWGKGSGLEEIGPEKWQLVGAGGLSITAVWHGKVKGRAMMGEGRSKDKVLVIRTQFRNFDDSTPIKYSPWQNEGMMFGGSDVVLKDAKDTRYNMVQFGMFSQIEGRQKGDVEVKASDPPVHDVLTFEGKAAEAAELILELPAKWWVPADGKAWRVVDAGKFRYRIPRSVWEGKSDPEVVYAEVVPGQWERCGPVGMTIDEVRLGKVKTEGFPAKGESKEPVFLVRTRFKVFDDKLTIRYLPWQGDAPFGLGNDINLEDDKENQYNLVVFGLFGSPEGRQKKEVELNASQPPVADLLTFQSKAANASVLFLELSARWQEQGAKGWQTVSKGRFRYRIPRSVWEKAR
jgi:hypothetical protein